MLRAMSARSGGGGVHVKGDGFGGVQEEMDQRYAPSVQDPPGQAQTASVHFIPAGLLQQARFGRPERDSSGLVRPS